MSCSVHDLVRLERRGVATAGIGTIPFADEALEQARMLGMPDLRMLLVPHPVQLLEAAELDALADDVLERVVRRLVTA
ncbi:MAG TPA: hypothetical protein VFI01_01675 [Gaiellaceae bacterium]|nr:hypothetical protein [Gaiellaceae bacterium]